MKTMYITLLVFVFHVYSISDKEIISVRMVSVITYSFQLLSDCLFHSDSLTVDPFAMATRWDVIGMRNV